MLLLSASGCGSSPTGAAQVTTGEQQAPGTTAAAEHPSGSAKLVQTSQAEKRNVVLVHLESTRARSTTPYNQDLKTTPYLDELSKNSLLVDQAHVGSVPRSLFASIAINCGIQPPPRLGEEADPTDVPVPCLANLLGDQGYDSAFFSSNADQYVYYATSSWGYKEGFSPPGPGAPAQHPDTDHRVATMDTTGFARPSYYGYEEDIMLKPSEDWLGGHKDKPFVAEYLLNTGHDEYNCLETRYGSEDLSNDDLNNHYLNCLRLQDIFLKNLIDQYKELGLYDNTIFVLFGDHGEGMGEHGRFMHGDTIWQEGLQVPLIIHAPGLTDGGERVGGLSNETDVLPTVLEMLGYEVKDGEYPGYSLLHELPEDRTLMFSCVSRRECVASIKGNEKYIYHYGNRPEQVFDLSKDPLEENDIAGQYSKEDLDKRRKDIFAWISKIDTRYYGYETPSEGADQSEDDARRLAEGSGGRSAGSTVRVGQPLTVGDAEWTVTSAYPANQLGSAIDSGTKQGNFVVVNFQLKNNSDKGMNLNSKSLALLDGNGRRYDFDTNTYLNVELAKNLFRVSVYPGATQEGQFIFEVDPNASQYKLQLGNATDPSANQSGYVDLRF